ncbi:MAG: AMP-binding protein [Steroidobacteraceae bacterium]|nr:AMP-binding protein [Steroidobacteraceae bacterium]
MGPRWLGSYPAGVRWDLGIAPAPAWRLLDEAAQRWPDRPALEFYGRRIDYRELHALAARTAAGLQRLGVRPGDRVGLYLPNCPQYPLAFFGALLAGAVVVNLSPLDAATTLAHKIEDSGAELLITLDLAALYPNAERLLATTRLRTLVVGGLADFAGVPIPAQCEPPRDAAHVPFMTLIDNDGHHTPQTIDDPASAIAVLQYTGGTTGTPKGAVLTHANITAAAAQCVETTQGEQPSMLPGAERMLLVLPLFHIYAELVMFLGIAMGAELVLHPKFDVAAVARDIAAKRITVLFGVPTMFVALTAWAREHAIDLGSLKHCGSGGAPLPAGIVGPFRQLTGVAITDGWGMSETTAAGTFSPRHGESRPGSCGLPLPQVELKVVAVDDPSRELAAGEHGELCIRGPNVMRGYWNSPAASAAALSADGWFRTGDVARIDEAGYVYIVERCKDMLLCGGFNVYPTIIEEAIYAHPDVAEVCVIGIADAYRGQSPKAFVRLKDGAAPLTLAALQAFLEGRIGRHEMVRALELRAELPKTPVGKLSKLALYEEERQRAAAAAPG